MFDVILFTDSPTYGKNRGHGAHAVASHIREYGYSCLVVDHVFTLTYDLYTKILDLAVSETTLVVGYSSTWITGSRDKHPLRQERTLSNILMDVEYSEQNNDTVNQWIDYPKKLNSNLRTVLGGARVDRFMNQPFDYVVRGLGETMFVDLLNSITGKVSGKVVDRLLDYDTEAKNPCWDFRKSLVKYTEFDLISKQDVLTIESARGCRFKCKFCAYPLIGRKKYQ